MTGGRGARPSGVPEILRCASGTALRRQGRSVARAKGSMPPSSTAAPSHTPPRRYSSAARPPQARARVVERVRQSAQPPADRSVQRLIRRRRCTAPADRCGARPRSAPRRRGNALERTLRLASPRRPPRGSRRKAPAPLRFARAAGSCHPPSPLSGGSADRVRSCRFSGCAAPAYACRLVVAAPPERLLNADVGLPRGAGSLGLRLALCGLAFLRAWLRNVMPEGSCVKARPRYAHQQDGRRSLDISKGSIACQAGLSACRRSAGAG